MPSIQDTALQQADWTTLAVVVALGVVGGSIFLSMPVVVSALASSYHFNDEQIGNFASIQLLFVSVGCLSALALTRLFQLRSLALLTMLVLLAADFASAYTTDYSLFLGLRALGGLAGGLAISTTTAALARTARPDRAFGIFLLSQIVFSMACTTGLPMLNGQAGVRGIFLVFVVLEAVLLVVIYGKLPEINLAGSAQTKRQTNTTREWAMCVLILTSILMFFMAIGAFWTYVGRIGEAAGISAAQVGRALSLAAIGGAAGALLPVWLQTRIGRAFPILLGGCSMILGLFCMHSYLNASTFLLAAGAFSFGWYLIYPYQLGVLSAVDRDGRSVVMAAALTGIGLGIGPAVVAPFTGSGLGITYRVAGACLMAAVGLVLTVLPFAGRDAVDPA